MGILIDLMTLPSVQLWLINSHQAPPVDNVWLQSSASSRRHRQRSLPPLCTWERSWLRRMPRESGVLPGFEE